MIELYDVAEDFYVEFRVKELFVLKAIAACNRYTLCQSIECHSNNHEDKNNIVMIFVDKSKRHIQVLDEEIFKVHHRQCVKFTHVLISEMAQSM